MLDQKLFRFVSSCRSRVSRPTYSRLTSSPRATCWCQHQERKKKGPHALLNLALFRPSHCNGIISFPTYVFISISITNLACINCFSIVKRSDDLPACRPDIAPPKDQRGWADWAGTNSCNPHASKSLATRTAPDVGALAAVVEDRTHKVRTQREVLDRPAA